MDVVVGAERQQAVAVRRNVAGVSCSGAHRSVLSRSVVMAYWSWQRVGSTSASAIVVALRVSGTGHDVSPAGARLRRHALHAFAAVPAGGSARVGGFRGCDLRGRAGYFALASELKLFDKLDPCCVVCCGVLRPPHSHVLLETLALSTQSHPGTVASGRSVSSGKPARSELQGRLAHGKHHCQWRRINKRIVAGSGPRQRVASVERACSLSSTTTG